MQRDNPIVLHDPYEKGPTMAFDRRTFIKGAGSAALAAGTLSDIAFAEEASAPAAPVAPSWLGTEPEVAEADITDTKETTLLIVGAGTAGLACAATALDMGLDFFLAEKLPVISESREYMGAVNTQLIKDAGIEADTGMLLNELSRYASGKCDRDLIKMWIDESAEAVEWYTPMFNAVGEAVMLPDYGGEEQGGTLYYSPVTEHMSGTAYIPPTRNEVICNHITDNGGVINFDYEMVKLVHEDGKVTGAIFNTDDGYVQVNAKYTVLACGGYAANPEMMQALQPDAVACTTAAAFNPPCTGTGIKAGMWAGAAKQNDPTPMLFDRGAVEPGVDAGYVDNGKGGLMLPGTRFQLNLGSQPFLKVNRNGKRFANESTPYDNICFAAGMQPGGVFCQVMDADAPQDMVRFMQGGCAAASREFMAQGGTIDSYIEMAGVDLVKKADTIEELADMLGFEGDAKDAFLATIDEYNALYDAQKDTQYGKEAYRLSQIRTAPFYGCWYGASLLTTLDGLCINADLQALDSSKNPIEGLYAIGDCSGNFFATNYPEYIVGVAAGRSTVQGRHLAKAVAAAEGIDVDAKDAEAKEALAAAVTEVPATPDYSEALAKVCW